MDRLWKALIPVFAMSMALGLAACEEEGTFEQSGEAIDESLEDTGDAIDESLDEADDTFDDTMDETGDTLDEPLQDDPLQDDPLQDDPLNDDPLGDGLSIARMGGAPERPAPRAVPEWFGLSRD